MERLQKWRQAIGGREGTGSRTGKMRRGGGGGARGGAQGEGGQGGGEAEHPVSAVHGQVGEDGGGMREWWAGEEEEEGAERVSGAGTVVSEMVGCYTTLSALRHEPCNPALLSSWCGGRGATSEGQAAASVSHDNDEQVRRLVRTVGARFAGDSLVAGAGLWMEAVGWKALDAGGEGKDECKKQAKSLLKRQQGNLHLWAAFAAAEAARGCEATARTVLLGAAQMAGSAESDCEGWPVLCKVRLELELGLLRDVWILPCPGAVAVFTPQGGQPRELETLAAEASAIRRAAALAAVMAVVDPSVFTAFDSTAGAGGGQSGLKKTLAPTAVIKARRGYGVLISEVRMYVCMCMYTHTQTHTHTLCIHMCRWLRERNRRRKRDTVP